MAARLPGLDGLRAIAISIVLVTHALGTKNFFPFVRAPIMGDMGVRAFFVLSGFIITSLLIAEQRKHGKISLRAFYARRVYRIFPAFYAYLAVMVVLGYLGWITLPTKDILFAATYTMNMNADRSWWIGHLWSLAVEEQFYLVWPLIMARLWRPHAGLIAFCAIVAGPFLRVSAWFAWPAARDLIEQAFPFVMDSLAIGCFLAIARDRLEAHRLYAKFLDSNWFWPVTCALLTAIAWPANGFNLVAGVSLGNLGFALVIHRSVRHPDKLFGRLMAWRPLTFVGLLCYSLYLWQQPFLNRHGDGILHTFPLHFILAFACALASFYLIEKPMLMLGVRRAARKRALMAARNA